MKNMKKIILLVIIVAVSFNLFATKYAGEIFRMGAGVRNFALGNSGVSDVNAIGLAYWNAALLHFAKDTKFELMHAEEYAGLLKYDTASAIWGKENKISVVITRIGIDDIPLTKLVNPDDPLSSSNRPYKYKSVNNSDLVAYVGISRKIGKYILGLTPKFAYRNLAEENGFGFGADISTYFEFNKLCLGIKLRDFFTTQILWGNGTHEIVNPGIDVEANYPFIFPVLLTESRIFLGSEMYTEGRDTAATLGLGFLSMDFHLGCEIMMHRAVNVYLGYDVRDFTAGLTLNLNAWQINYAFENDTELENSHRLSIGYKL
ncbi:MAG: hypothetical protein Q7J16_05780 [Candidatus Cloacimonadales bacterium]|nr:hypothetical protein [Candidatus Cloacimonadales bacterium]